ATSRSPTSRRSSRRAPARRQAPEKTKPARGRSGNRRSSRQSPVVRGEPAERMMLPRGAPAHHQKGGFVDGEGGIRTLEAGISPPNALAGRRLQPLGHFSRAPGSYRSPGGPSAS